MTYSLPPAGVKEGTIIRVEDNATIPPDPGNVDYQAFLTWQSQGNEPGEYVVPSFVIENHNG
jgi:hypothetical protein